MTRTHMNRIKQYNLCTFPGYKRHAYYEFFARMVKNVWKHTFAKIGEDWVFLALLGIIMAIISFAMDYGISKCNMSR